MIKFKQNGPKEWSIIYNEEELIKLSLVSSSITNKFFIITKFVENVSSYWGDEFDEWFVNLLKRSSSEEEGRVPLLDEVEVRKMKDFSNSYIDSLSIDFSQFVDESKAKRSSILFTAEEIEKIIKLSASLKIYSVISNSENLRFGQKLHREIYNKIASDIMETEIIYKIFNIIKTKTFRYNLTDKYMWDYIKLVQCKSIDVHVVEIFNFIMNSILVLCEEGRNPITYFVGVIDESVKWFLRSVYKGSVVYNDSVSTEDIHGINVDNLKTYAYNDTLGRLKAIAFEKIYEELEKQNTMKFGEVGESDEFVIHFHDRVSKIEFISPLCEALVFPVLSRTTQIPYKHFKTVLPEDTAVLSVYVQDLLTRTFGGEYKSLFSLLSYYPLNSPSVATTYKLKSVHEFLDIQPKRNFYGFNTKDFPYRLLCHFVGRVPRVNFCNVITGKKLAGIPLSKIESDMINFFTLYFSNGLEDKFQIMMSKLNHDF